MYTLLVDATGKVFYKSYAKENDNNATIGNVIKYNNIDCLLMFAKMPKLK